MIAPCSNSSVIHVVAAARRYAAGSVGSAAIASSNAASASA